MALYWPADEAKGEEASPFGPLIAASADYLKGHQAGDSFHGYHFRILTRQGKNAPGGAFSYVINGRMIAGFALIAYPAEYGESGVMTFIVDNLARFTRRIWARRPENWQRESGIQPGRFVDESRRSVVSQGRARLGNPA